MAAICIAALIIFTQINRLIPLTEWLDKDEMGIVERDIRELHDVIIIADKLEEPVYLLRDAVIDNLIDGTVYRFFVSADKYDEATERFKPFLNNLARTAKSMANSTNSPNDPLYHIYRLPHIRNDYPSIAANGPTEMSLISRARFRLLDFEDLISGGKLQVDTEG